MKAAITSLLLAAQVATAYNYIPGISLKDYTEGQPVGPIKVNSLFSHEDIVSLDFYSLKFCPISKERLQETARNEKLGEVIWGDRIAPSRYEASMMQPIRCKTVCKTEVSPLELQRFEKRINSGYRGTFVLDNLPVVSNGSWVLGGTCPSRQQIFDTHTRGWALGVPQSCLLDHTAINNHLALHILVNEHIKKDEQNPESRYVIVGFYVIPYSIKHMDSCDNDPTFNVDSASHQRVTTRPSETSSITWSYSVEWHLTDVQWGNRWDSYLNLAFSNRNARVHWLGIVNSSLIILCLATIVAMIMFRILRLDINRYREIDYDEQQEIIDEVGWKLVHGDVFRAPKWPRMFSILTGTGVQLLGMSVAVFVFALLGVLSPANRGGLLTTTILLFVLMSLPNGYITALMLKTFDCFDWRAIFGAALFFPGCAFALWVISEILIIALRPSYNSAPVAYNTLFLFVLWTGVSLPLVLLGASFGRKGPNMDPPVKVNTLVRPIPPQRWYLETWFLMIAPGLVPFGAAFIELRFILLSMWQGMVYYVFGFLSLTAITVILVSIEVTIVIVYFMLVFEDHRWWWPSFVIPGGMGLHFFLYSLYYSQTQVHIQTGLSMFLYVAIMFLFSSALYIAIGTIGIISAYIFVRIIYSSIKTD